MSIVDIESVTELTNRLIEKDETIKRMHAALNLICLLAEKEKPHLGKPRASGVYDGCIPCITYLAQHFGAYGEYFTDKEFNAESERILAELKNAKQNP